MQQTDIPDNQLKTVTDTDKVVGNKIDISVVILNYNVREFLENALNSVFRAIHNLDAEVFVVDNASADLSADMVRRKFPDVRLIVNDDNKGFAAGNNVALRQCRGKYILVLNPDTLIQENTLSVMKEFMDSHPEAGAASCKVLNSDGTLQLTCKRSFPTPWVAFTKIAGLSALFPKSRWFGKYNLTYLPENEVHEVEAVAGSFMFLRREVLETAGLLDESYFMYGEDLDWCYRIWKAGWKIFYVPTTQIIHYKGESTTRSGFDDIRLFYEAMEVFVEKHIKKRYSVWMILLLKFAIGVRAFTAKVTRSIAMAWMPLLDAVSIQSAVLLSIYIKYDEFITPGWIGSPVFFYSTILTATTFVWLVTLYFLDNYHKRKLSISQSILASVIGFFIISTISLFSKEFIFSRFVVFMTFIFALAFVTGWRLLALLVMKKGSHRRLWSMKVFQKNTLIIGSDEHARQLGQRIRQRVDSPYRIVGFITANESVSENDTALGPISDLPRLITQYKVSEVIISSATVSNALIMSLIQTLHALPVNVRLSPAGSEVIIGKSYINRLEPVPLLSLENETDNPFNRFIKRTLDILTAATGLFLGILPFFFLFITGRIRRMEFRYLNFRQKVTVLRCWTVNGLKPCFFSLMYRVLTGHFSMIGSPLIWQKNLKPDQPDKYRFLSRRPGLISLMEVITDEQDLANETMHIRYDFYYVNNYSLKLDIEILLRKLFKV